MSAAKTPANFGKLPIAEKIVWLFETRVTEAHRSAIETPLKISEEQFDRTIARARDLGVEKGLRITPIYERSGWWTCDPTQRIAATAVHETLKRNAGEAARHARVYAKFGQLDSFTNWHEAATAGTVSAFIANLSQLPVGSTFDYVLHRVDAAETAGVGFVARP